MQGPGERPRATSRARARRDTDNPRPSVKDGRDPVPDHPHPRLDPRCQRLGLGQSLGAGAPRARQGEASELTLPSDERFKLNLKLHVDLAQGPGRLGLQFKLTASETLGPEDGVTVPHPLGRCMWRATRGPWCCISAPGDLSLKTYHHGRPELSAIAALPQKPRGMLQDLPG